VDTFLNVCPTGWHVPSDDRENGDSEWQKLVNALGGESVAGGKMKEAGMTHWIFDNTDATNESGFSGLPGGYRTSGGTFSSIGENSEWWSSTESSALNAWFRELYDISGSVGKFGGTKGVGLSVRCLRD